MIQKIIIAVLIMTNFQGFAQTTESKPPKKDVNFSIRANANYQFFSFSGRRTNSLALGGVIEKGISYGATAGLFVNYITRMEDAYLQEANLPEYQNVIYFAPFVRKYFHKAFDGTYAGFTMGIGIPSDKGTQWDIGGQLGYSIHKNKIVIDIMINAGFGSFRYYVTDRTQGGYITNETFYRDYGFYFRPGISIGFAN